jgi:hypothetical protein
MSYNVNEAPLKVASMSWLWKNSMPRQPPKDMKVCWGVHDEHFQCMNQFDDIYGYFFYFLIL